MAHRKVIIVAMSSAGCLLLTLRKEFHSSDHATATQSDMHKQEHTPIIPITRLQQGNSQQPDPSVESQMGAACVCVCASECVVEPLGSQGPCRALGVLIRQPQPSTVHYR